MSFEALNCALAGACSGCAWIERPYQEQIDAKRSLLADAIRAAGFAEPRAGLRVVSVAAGGLRDRVDLTIDRTSGERRIGLFEIGARGIIDIKACPALSPRLNDFLLAFRSIPLDVQRGSVRLRVAPNGAFGAWLDFANADVKRLLDERDALDRLRAVAFVEIGQKRKALVEKDGRLKLGSPEFRPWFETYSGENQKPIALQCNVGSFTQPGFAANQTLVKEAMDAFAAADVRSAVEFGSGVGNFTAAMAAAGAHVTACESDALACDGLERSLREAGLEANVTIKRGDFHRSGERAAELALEGVECVFVDPPRSGLKGFLQRLAAVAPLAQPRAFIYVSCNAESLGVDLAALRGMGYGLESTALIDQFPQSPHFESVTRLRRIN